MKVSPRICWTNINKQGDFNIPPSLTLLRGYKYGIDNVTTLTKYASNICTDNNINLLTQHQRENIYPNYCITFTLNYINPFFNKILVSVVLNTGIMRYRFQRICTYLFVMELTSLTICSLDKDLIVDSL